MKQILVMALSGSAIAHDANVRLWFSYPTVQQKRKKKLIIAGNNCVEIVELTSKFHPQAL